MFKKIFGQDNIFSYLIDRINDNKADGSYLFTGPKGVGKWAYGYLFASAFCCQSLADGPCGKCTSCKAASRFRHPDIQYLFPFPNIDASKKQVTVFPFSDPTTGAKFSRAASEEIQKFLEEKAEDPFRIVRFDAKVNIPVEVVRDLRKFLALRPMWEGKKAVVISDIENMAPHCADLFLKTIEEPPRDTVIILTSATPEKLPATIISRCRVLTFQSPDEEEVRDYLDSYFKRRKIDYRFISRASNFSPGMGRALIEENAIELRDMILGLMKSAAGNREYIDSNFAKFSPDFDIAGDGINAVTLLTWILRDIIIMHNGGGVDEIINCDRAEILAGLANALSSEKAGDLLGDLGDIKIACELSNVMPTTAFRHLLAVIKRNLSPQAIA